MATGGRVSTVVSSDVIALITAQVCRQSGLSSVYQELLDFDGDEIYFAPAPSLVGHTFDARTLMTLLQVRQLLAALPPGASVPSIASELLDVRDVELARNDDSDDFVVSERLTSLMMAQLAENPELGAVFTDLLDAEGTDMSLKPASTYLPVGAEVPFAEAVKAARDRGEVALGYRLPRSGGASGAVVVNPRKSAVARFEPDAQLIVLTAGYRLRVEQREAALVR